MTAPNLAATVLQILLPLTCCSIAAKLLSHTLFSWHPVFISIGYLGFFGQGVLTSFAVREQEGDERSRLLTAHALWQLGGVSFVSLGAWATWVSRVDRGLPHLGTLHAVLGFIVLLLTAATALGGTLAFGKTGLLQLVPEQHRATVKAVHRKAGAAVLISACSVMELGLSKGQVHLGWWNRAWMVSVAIIGVLVAYLAWQPKPAHAFKEPIINGARSAKVHHY